MKLLKHFDSDYKPGSAVKPDEVASLLGQLNFAAQMVDGGTVFLDRMYSQFRGVIVDWKRGLVRFEGRPQALRLSKEFFPTHGETATTNYYLLFNNLFRMPV